MPLCGPHAVGVTRATIMVHHMHSNAPLPLAAKCQGKPKVFNPVWRGKIQPEFSQLSLPLGFLLRSFSQFFTAPLSIAAAAAAAVFRCRLLVCRT